MGHNLKRRCPLVSGKESVRGRTWGTWEDLCDIGVPGCASLIAELGRHGVPWSPCSADEGEAVVS